jgi:hypothetical protein
MKDKPGDLSWALFQEYFLEPGTPKAVTLPGRVPATIFVSEHARTMGLRLPAGAQCRKIVSPLRQIEIEVRPGKPPVLELSTSAGPLFKEFLLFALDVAHAVQGGEIDVGPAVDRALLAWKSLLQKAVRLSREEEIGLYGELLCLNRIHAALGDAALSTWTGPRREPHDFRLESVELEVKTTASTARRHFINGWDQLTPSAGLALFLLSVHLEPAGGSDGMTLPELVESVRGRFRPANRPALDKMLDAVGYSPEDTPQYTERFRMRAPNKLVPVDDACPRLTRAQLGMSAPLATRIHEVHYRVDVEGLGFEEESPAYLRVLPGGRT